MDIRQIIVLALFCIPACQCSSNNNIQQKPASDKVVAATPSILVGAARLDLLLPEVKGKNIALVVNHTSLIGTTHLADTLQRLGLSIRKIFAPEHGFRGMAAN